MHRGLKVVLGTLAVAGLLLGLLGAVALAQDTAPTTSLQKVANILGIGEDTLNDAITQAQGQQLDEAVQQGLITEQQKTLILQNQQIRDALAKVRQSELKDDLDEAVQEGVITAEERDLILERLEEGAGWGPGMHGPGGMGMHGPGGMMGGRWGGPGGMMGGWGW